MRRDEIRAGYLLGMILAQKSDREGAVLELSRYLKAPDAQLVKAHLAAIENGTAK